MFKRSQQLWRRSVSAPGPRVFISYRRADSIQLTGRLTTTLKQRFGSRSVFVDLDDLPGGVEFGPHLMEHLRRCSATLVVMGPRWSGPLDNGTFRLNDPDDHVRIETATALAMNGHRVIPILIGDTPLPAPEDLPEDIRSLRELNALRIDPMQHYERDVSRLVRQLAGSWFRSMYLQRTIRMATMLVAALAVLVTITLFKDHMERRALLRVRAEARALVIPLVEKYVFVLKDHMRVLGDSEPRAYMDVRNEEEKQNDSIRRRYSAAFMALSVAMPQGLELVDLGWGVHDSLLLANWFEGLRVGVHEPLRLRVTPYIVQPTVDLKTELWRVVYRNNGQWRERDSLSWDHDLIALQRAYTVVMPDLSANAAHYIAQWDAIKARLDVGR